MMVVKLAVAVHENKSNCYSWSCVLLLWRCLVEGPRLAVALSRGRVLLVAEQGQCVLCVNRAESKY
jgi:hypothetical protein